LLDAADSVPSSGSGLRRARPGLSGILWVGGDRH
jgi:hypothetical protein